MERGKTKDRILDVALDLFSVKGYEATSISQVADEVGVRKASLYSHFASKQEILDTLVDTTMEEFNKHSIFVKANWDDPVYTADKEGMTAEDVAAMIKGQIAFIVQEPKISKVRKMLTVEQYRNPELRKAHSKLTYDDILKYNIGLMKFLMRQGLLIEEDPEIMAAQFAWPVSMWTYLCDKEPDKLTEVMELIDRHVQQFFRVYGK